MLTINHDNYDTWLMLYLDNELTAAEREAVEAFAKANPAIQEELDGLKETMLQPELPGAMPGRERLLMPELWNEEALTLQQQQLLMLVDNELPQAEKETIEAKISGSSSLQKEWNLLQKTKFSMGRPGEMPGKDQLYRHERTRVIPFGRIVRFAAAAAILGFGLFFANSLLTNRAVDTVNEGLVSKPAIQDKQPVLSPNDTIANPQQGQQSVQNEAVMNYAAVESPNAPLQPVQKAIARNEATQMGSSLKKDIPAEVAANEGSDAFTNREPADKLVATRVVEVEGLTEIANPSSINTTNVELAVIHPEGRPASQEEVMSVDELSDEGTINIGGARIPKQKIRNVYRNITRPITRTLERGGLQLASAK